MASPTTLDQALVTIFFWGISCYYYSISAELHTLFTTVSFCDMIVARLDKVNHIRNAANSGGQGRGYVRIG